MGTTRLARLDSTAQKPRGLFIEVKLGVVHKRGARRDEMVVMTQTKKSYLKRCTTIHTFVGYQNRSKLQSHKETPKAMK